MKTSLFILNSIFYFNLFTLGMYIISPMSINSDYRILNILYISINILMMRLGFMAGLKYINSRCKKGAFCRNISMKYDLSKYYYAILAFYLFTFLLRYAYMLYLPPFNISALINRIAIGVSDPYLGRHFLHGDRTIPWTFYFLTSIVDSLFFIISFLNWGRLKFIVRILLFFLIGIEVFYWLGTGTNFGVIMLVSCMVLTFLMQIKRVDLPKSKIFLISFFCIIALSIVLVVFMYNMEGRSGGDLDNISGTEFLALGPSVNIENSTFFVLLPYRLQVLLLFIFSYLTQGYMFLENIYNIDFHWGAFFGNNPALQSLAQDFLGFNPEINSYQMQMERLGVDSYVNWHSCYLWLANDFTLVGVPFVVFFISKFASSALIIYRQNKDIISGVIFVVFANMLLFMFANNNYLSSVFYSFMFIFPFWYFTVYKNKG